MRHAMLEHLPFIAGAIAAVIVPAVLGRSMTREANAYVRVDMAKVTVYRGSRRAQLALVTGCVGASVITVDGKLAGWVVGSWFQWGMLVGGLMAVGIGIALLVHRMCVEVDEHGVSVTGFAGRRRSIGWFDIVGVSFEEQSGKLIIEGAHGDRLSTYLVLRGSCTLLDVLAERLSHVNASGPIAAARRSLGVCE